MKKLILTVAILVGGVSAYASSDVVINDEVITTITTEDFKEISLDQLTEAIVYAVQKDFASATLGKAYVNSSEQYKLMLTIDGAEKAVYIDKEGNWLEESDIVIEE